MAKKDLSFRAGGSINLEIGDDFEGSAFSMHSGVHQIRVAVGDDDLTIGEEYYDYQMGNTDRKVEILSEFFVFEESPFSEMIRDRVEYATRKAEVKVRAAQIRLDEIQDRLGKFRFPKISVDLEANMDHPSPERPEPPMPPVSRPAGRKGASNEERWNA